jgi:hypothetical protein
MFFYRYDQTKREIKAHINQVFEDIPIYGAAKVHQQLLEELRILFLISFLFKLICGKIITGITEFVGMLPQSYGIHFQTIIEIVLISMNLKI